MRRVAALSLIALALAGCANNGLRDLRSNSSGPDEFMVNPAKPLQKPDSYKTLPVPTPGQSNLTDRSAVNEGIAAFGGRAGSPNAPVPASDAALVRHASRMGVQTGIRKALAESDAKFRKRKQRFTQIRIVPVDRYNQAYGRLALDPHQEAERWRRAGARLPSYPPKERRR